MLQTKGGIMKILSFLSLLMFAMLANTHAQESDDLLEMSLDDLMNIEVVSSTKKAEKINRAPSVINSISKQQRETYGWNTINEILFAQPGFFHSIDYDRHTAGFRGASESWNNNHLLMLIDGIPYNDNQYGSAYTSEITPLFFANNIEIIRGPGSALYGSNATNGVISINTSVPKKVESTLDMRLSYGSFNTLSFDVLSNYDSEIASFSVGYNKYQTDGFEYETVDASGRVDNAGNLLKLETNDNRNSDYLYAKVLPKGALEGLMLQMHFQRWEFETNYGWLFQIPDIEESMQESRNMIALRYKPEMEGPLQFELTTRYQYHAVNWFMQLYEHNSFEGFYPAGVNEYLITNTEDFFSRAQLSYDFNDQGTSLLVGFESDIFWYGGKDKEHSSNVDLVETSEPYPNGEMRPLGQWLGWIGDNNVMNYAAFMQITSGNLFSDHISAVAGMRYDYQSFDFYTLDEVDPTATENKTFSQVGPRLGLVYHPTDDLSFKVLFGKAFRAPSPTEMFGANTWTLASNVRIIKPEEIYTADFAIDYMLNPNINMKLNAFYSDFKNKTAYSPTGNNAIANIFSTETAGVEFETNFKVDNFVGYLNYSYTQLLEETIAEEQQVAIFESDEIVWAPKQLIKIGLSYRISDFRLTATGIYTDKFLRRESDNLISSNVIRRGNEVDASFVLNFKAEYQVLKHVRVNFKVNNLLDSEYYIIKNTDMPFDYKMPGVNIMSQIIVDI